MLYVRSSRLFILAISCLLIPHFAFAALSGLNPSALKLKIYKVGISTSPLCTNPTVVFQATSPGYTDFLTAPTLGSG